MANMDLDDIIKDLNNRFAQELPEFYKRRLIFWKDEDGEFKDDINGISLDKAIVLSLDETNNFTVKKLLTVDDTTSNYLVYCPFAYDDLEDDWLLNLELYSEVFRADLVSIYLDEIGLDVRPDFIKFVKEHRKFFNAKDRRSSIKNFRREISNLPNFHLALMASICNNSDLSYEKIIKKVILEGFDKDNNDIYQKFLTYGEDQAFWYLVNKSVGYYGGEDPSIENLFTHMALTALTRTLPVEYLRGLEDFISNQHESRCYDLMAEWIMEDGKENLENLLSYVENKIYLRDRLKEAPIEDLVDAEIFPCTNEVILKKLMTDINNHVIDVGLIIKTEDKRKTLAWYKDYAPYYNCLRQLAKMEDFSKNHASGFHIMEAKKLWENYTKDYYKMDTAYRLYHIAFDKALNRANENLDDHIKQVTEIAEGLYSHWFLGELGDNWAKAAGNELRDYGHILGIDQQVDFYRHRVEGADSRVYVIISDAFRYELAVELAEDLRLETQSRVELSSCQAIFPTITKFGMAALLPHKELKIEQVSNGNLQIRADGESTEANNRQKVLQNRNPKSVALKYKDILPMKRSERQDLVKGMEVVYIYHDRVDEASHISDRQVFPACLDAIDEIKNIVRIIRNEFGGTRVFVTADHGFLYTNLPLNEDSKVDKTSPSEKDVEVGRRYLITKKGTDVDYLMPVKFIDENYDAFSPRESVRIKKKGGGLNFVHGGISLQEMVVPVIDYHYLRSNSLAYRTNREKYDTKPVDIDLLSSSRKITNMIFSLNFYQKEAIGPNRRSASFILYFIDSDGMEISDKARIIADRKSENLQNRSFRCDFNLKSRNYDKRESYYLVIEDESGLRIPQKEVFQIDIAMDIDEFDFFG